MYTDKKVQLIDQALDNRQSNPLAFALAIELLACELAELCDLSDTDSATREDHQ